ncbi:unnamed protein product, partial [Prunus brigantina]
CSKKCITCVWVQSNRDQKALSLCGDIMFMRKNMMKELRQIIEANPVFRGKLKYPSIKSHRLHKLINQRERENPRPNPVIKTLFVDHVCEPQENVPLPQPIGNNLEDCLSLSLSTGNSLQMRSPGAVSLNAAKSPAIEVIDYPCLSKKMFFLILDEVKSTVTDPGSKVTCLRLPYPIWNLGVLET